MGIINLFDVVECNQNIEICDWIILEKGDKLVVANKSHKSWVWLKHPQIAELQRYSIANAKCIDKFFEKFKVIGKMVEQLNEK